MTNNIIIPALIAGCLTWTAASPAAKADPLYIEVESAPLHIETYPRTVYEGRPVFYADGHWYYRHGPGWAYYREEPRPLVAYRASPAYRHHRHHHHWHHR